MQKKKPKKTECTIIYAFKNNLKRNRKSGKFWAIRGQAIEWYKRKCSTVSTF